MEKDYDFSGWATKALLKCADGRTIMKDAFKDDDGQTVPLVWNHQHNRPDDILGHALLENRNDGVYTYCTFNDTDSAKKAKLLVEHGDVNALSIYANKLKQSGMNVLHGAIREVSLVLAGANPGAFIDNVIVHEEESEDSAIIYTGEEIELNHSSEKAEPEEETTKKDDKDMGENKNNDKTVKDVFDGMTEEQQAVVHFLVGAVLEDKKDKEDKEDGGDENKMKHNVFENDETNPENALSHSEVLSILADGKRYGSLKESMLQHGIENIGYLFPDYKNVTNEPLFIDRDQTWVTKVMANVKKTPFSRIKSVFANITADEARAKGYITGKEKTNEVFTLLKRTTDPTTVYKKQSFDRDDIVDITDFDVVSWTKKEMRGKLDEELARAFLIGDGRPSSSDDHINETHVRPIWTDEDLFTVKCDVNVKPNATGADKAKEFVKSALKARKNYKGSGNPSMYANEDIITECLLLEDRNERRIYNSINDLAMVLRVKEIITVPVMENITRNVKGVTKELLGIMVNLRDYSVGADKGGAVNMFDDFDIDYNKEKYLIETRCSGALTVPYSAIAFECVEAAE